MHLNKIQTNYSELFYNMNFINKIDFTCFILNNEKNMEYNYKFIYILSEIIIKQAKN